MRINSKLQGTPTRARSGNRCWTRRSRALCKFCPMCRPLRISTRLPSPRSQSRCCPVRDCRRGIMYCCACTSHIAHCMGNLADSQFVGSHHIVRPCFVAERLALAMKSPISCVCYHYMHIGDGAFPTPHAENLLFVLMVMLYLGPRAGQQANGTLAAMFVKMYEDFLRNKQEQGLVFAACTPNAAAHQPLSWTQIATLQQKPTAPDSEQQN